MRVNTCIPADEAFAKADDYSLNRKPFFIVVDYEKENSFLFPLDNIPSWIHFSFNGLAVNDFSFESDSKELAPRYVEYPVYLKGFSEIIDNIQRGNSYLANYTAKTELGTSLTLQQIYATSKAHYRLLLDDLFTVFSPETFVVIESGRIATFPMKGTIDASVQNAKQVVLDDEKEKAEHATITDLLRNDLSKVAEHVVVRRYRFVREVKSDTDSLLQVSSHIEGDIVPEFSGRIGSVLRALLPAGSICGAPKKKTVEIIKQAEGEPRGFYCGVAGVFDGDRFDSAVLIRYIEQCADKLYYRSGGGLTFLSDPEKEYQELKSKVYVPIA